MKKINFKSPRYILPLICLPFILILFSVFSRSSSLAKSQKDSTQINLKSEIAEVSSQVQSQKLQDKLQAFQDKFTKGDGYSAVENLADEDPLKADGSSVYSEKEKRMLDSIELSIRSRYASMQKSTAGKQAKPLNNFSSAKEFSRSQLAQDRALSAALSAIQPGAKPIDFQQSRAQDPMELFRAQMAIIDSMGKANDPGRKSVQAKQKTSEEFSGAVKQGALKVSMISPAKALNFNTITTLEKQGVNIPAVIDEQVTGFSGSRIRMRLLCDIWAGKFLIKKGSYLYGVISSFSAQRVQVSVSSALIDGEILPINLSVYDRDGQRGIYVPSSVFREFSKELAGSSIGNLEINESGEENKQLMSLLGRVFQSSSGAASRLIRQNKARINYASIIYLVDPGELKSRQNNFEDKEK